jgi:mRNA interferase MazF
MPTRGEIWWVNLDPTVGVELRKTRPGVVLSTPQFDHLAIRLVVVLTSWQSHFHQHANKVLVPATPANGLRADSAGDVLQLRAVSTERFGGKLGVLEPLIVQALADALTAAVGALE